MNQIVVTGTDTGIGKTVFSAGLTALLDANYWKPVQSGLDEETDSELVARLAALAPGRVLPERYRLRTPASPDQSAAIDGVRIDAEGMAPPPPDERPLVIEAAGGLMVPLTETALYIDVYARWRLPVVLCARTSLGTINHTLLSIEALRARRIEPVGVAFIGDGHPQNEQAICEFGRVRKLGRLPWLSPLDPATLRSAFASAFNKKDFVS